jgi:hypothetical protein
MAGGDVPVELDVGRRCLLHQRDVAGGDVDVDHPGRRRERLVGESDDRGIPDLVGAELDVVRLGVDLEHDRTAVATHDPNRRLGFVPLVEGEVALEWLDTGDPAARLVWHQLVPRRRVVERRPHHPEVDRILVRDDDEPITPVVDLVLDVVPAGAHALGCRQRVAGVQ